MFLPYGKSLRERSRVREGIELGMGGSQALQFCKVEVRHRSPEQEKAAHAACWTWVVCISRIEDAAPAGSFSIFQPDLVI